MPGVRAGPGRALRHLGRAVRARAPPPQARRGLRPATGRPATATVTAVLVSHDGVRWLPTVLTALAAQTVPLDRVVAVDTGSDDATAALLRASYDVMLQLPADTGFGAAVAAGLAAAPRTDWVWLLHDDCAPAPDALEQLLAGDPTAAVRGPKVLDWADPRSLVEIGLTTDGVGRRLTGLEPGELDQGQHDARRDVLAVGTAGALVRRAVWDALGGLDPALPRRRDDLDLGRRAWAAGHRVVVVPSARVRHARALTTGLRRSGRVVAQDRQAQSYVLLAHATGPQLVPALARLVVGALLRALLLVLRRRPRYAADELAALHVPPVALVRARRARRRARTVPAVQLRPLLASPARLRGVIAGLGALAAAAPRRRRRPGPGLLLTLALAVVALLAERSLLVGGALAGGRLLPVPGSAGALLRAYADGGDAAVGSLGLLSLAALGRAPMVVDVLLLASVPAAGAVAYAVAGQLVRRRALRLWAGATWALLPVATGAVAAGRLDAAVVQIALPAGMLGGYRVATRDPRGRWQAAWGLGLALAGVVALAPVLWPLAAGLLLALAARGRDRPRRLLAVGIVLAVPPLVLLPRSLDVAAVLHGPGRLAPDLVDASLATWRLLLLSPGGPGLPAAVVTAGLLLAAAAALLRTGREEAVAVGWVVALVGLGAALLLTRVDVDGGPVWPGGPLQVAAAGLLTAAVVGAEGLPDRLQRNTFGRRQVAASVLVAVAAAVPVLCAATWVARAAGGPLARGEVQALPAYARAELGAAGLRALVLDPAPDGTVAYAVTGPAGPRLGDPPPVLLDGVVADLLSPRGSSAAQALAARAVRYVVLAGDSPQDAAALDSQPGLLRQAGPPLWRVLAPAVRPPAPARRGLWPQALVLVGVAVLAGPAAPRRQGLERVR